MAKKSKWFDEVFLPSLTEKMEKNEKYPNTMILSEKQYEICMRNFQPQQCYGDYGDFTNYTYEANGYRYLIYFRGRYTFLSCRVDDRKSKNK